MCSTLLKHQVTHNHEKFSATGVYKLTCPDCGKAHIRETGRNYSKRYSEYLGTFRNKCNSSKFAQHLNQHTHNFGSIENITKILNYQKKGQQTL